MAVGALDARAIGVVEQNKFATDFVLVGRHALAKNAQRRITVALWHVAQHLVVGAVFLDDVEDMLEDAWFPDPLRNWPRRLAGAWRQRGLLQQWIAHIFEG